MNRKSLYLLVIITALNTSTSHAETVKASELCPQIGEMAEKVMTARQSGTTLSKLLSIEVGDPKIANLMKTIVMSAYDKPAYSSDEMQRKTIAEFRNAHELECYKIIKN